ncbi:hypothetical protein [Clostridium sp. MD294]|uniref:hypothetical protein n=1 Tax=Clostridium sp. MD294 TaxID=97138 RepID=UPI0002C8B0C0|nr:hypothetical protein [Clostridium sp. MD294]NDO46006.1 hypothetical protein [Clostridium sp. MD294]USF30330.1 hypothetical protein C820_001771 [Clostridium sp. MD294]
MRNISIDFISQNDVRISIDGKELEDISGFSLKIKEGKIPKCSVEKKAFKELKKLEVIRNDKIPILRSIPEAVKELKEEDPKTSITTSSVRSLVKEGKVLKYPKGKQIQVDLDEIKEYYRNGGKMTKVKPNGKLQAIF